MGSTVSRMLQTHINNVTILFAIKSTLLLLYTQTSVWYSNNKNYVWCDFHSPFSHTQSILLPPWTIVLLLYLYGGAIKWWRSHINISLSRDVDENLKYVENLIWLVTVGIKLLCPFPEVLYKLQDIIIILSWWAFMFIDSTDQLKACFSSWPLIKIREPTCEYCLKKHNDTWGLSSINLSLLWTFLKEYTY